MAERFGFRVDRVQRRGTGERAEARKAPGDDGGALPPAHTHGRGGASRTTSLRGGLDGGGVSGRSAALPYVCFFW